MSHEPFLSTLREATMRTQVLATLVAATTATSAISLSAVSCKATVPSGSTLHEGSETCDLGAIEQVIETQGVIAALQSDATTCLDDGSETALDVETATATATEPGTQSTATNEALGNTGTESGITPDSAMITSDTSTATEGFALLGDQPQRLQLRLVIGWRVMNDLLEAVASQAVNGSGGTGSAADVARLKSQAQAALAELRPALRDLKVTVHGTVAYSYSDLYNIVKTNFVDPKVYGYNGAFSRIIHRRYARGRGIVYNIVSQKLAEGLAEFHATAASELAQLSDGTIGVQIERFNGSLSTAEGSFLTLYLDGKVVGRPVAYSEAKELAETARRELPKLLATPEGQAVTALATDALAAARQKCVCKVVNGICGIYKDDRMLYYLPGTPYCQSGSVDHCPSLRAAAGAQCQ
jgi:hypothetical protein